MSSPSPVIQALGLGKKFTESGIEVDVFRGLDLAIAAGEIVSIVGASGVGKSTLLHLLSGLDHATAGEVQIDGTVLAGMSQAGLSRLRNQKLGFIYQFHHLLPEFTALENVAMPLLIRGEKVPAARAAASQLLERVGLGKRMAHKPGELSGGERQRAAVARALITKPRCILADEPTGNLDESTAAGVFELMLELNRAEATSFVLVTHDRRLAKRADRALELTGGKLQPLA
jgi:lipoprotein-releasing system ATP-binding protein